jgi:CheY-like chemotaxis protein
MTGPDGTPNGVRVVLADDHAPFRRNVAEMLSLVEDIEVVAEANDHEGALAAASEHAPDVVLLDLEMPGDVGADGSLRRMLSLPSPPSVVVLTMHDEPGMIRRFLSRGAVGYFPKSAEMGELVEAVREAARARPSDVKGDRWPAGDGEMARRIRGHDWAQTPLGPIGGWPESLRTTVDPMLGSEAIMVARVVRERGEVPHARGERGRPRHLHARRRRPRHRVDQERRAREGLVRRGGHRPAPLRVLHARAGRGWRSRAGARRGDRRTTARASTPRWSGG